MYLRQSRIEDARSTSRKANANGSESLRKVSEKKPGINWHTEMSPERSIFAFTSSNLPAYIPF